MIVLAERAEDMGEACRLIGPQKKKKVSAKGKEEHRGHRGFIALRILDTEHRTKKETRRYQFCY